MVCRKWWTPRAQESQELPLALIRPRAGAYLAPRGQLVAMGLMAAKIQMRTKLLAGAGGREAVDTDEVLAEAQATAVTTGTAGTTSETDLGGRGSRLRDRRRRARGRGDDDDREHHERSAGFTKRTFGETRRRQRW